MASLLPLRPLCGRLFQSFTHSTPTTAAIAPAATSFAAFSTTSAQQKPKFSKQITREKKKIGRAMRRRRDQNKQRGVSSINRSGPKEKNSMSHVKLPEPADYKPKVEVDPSHGLWGFFAKPGVLMETPEEMVKHGRAWTVEELRKKSWEDLHSLWWVCCREKNMLSTAREELKRAKMGFGDQELSLREGEVRTTQRSIKHVLTERFYTWQDARQTARTDPEIDLDNTDGNAYVPGSAYENEVMDPAEVEETVEHAVSNEAEKKMNEALNDQAKEEKAEAKKEKTEAEEKAGVIKDSEPAKQPV